MGKIIAICNQKGGVGKTTTCINLSAALTYLGKKVLIIDLDPQGNATSGLGIDKHKLTHSIYQALLKEVVLSEIILPTSLDLLKLIPAQIELIGAEVELNRIEGGQFVLKKILSGIEENFDFLFIDLPPSLGMLTVNALTAAHSVLIPIQCEYYALEGLSQLLFTLEKVKQAFNPGLLREGILLTMADFRTNLSQEVIAEARRHFGNEVYQTVIPRSIRLSEAPGFGKPIFLYAPESQGAIKYRELAQEFLLHNTEINVNANISSG
ncbi:MAG: AAA family ATPase [Candidatus Omnitrophica bacterium]|nr:AAA family ATPase [Candidatus Omnitrophota bacterium]MCM8798329.1 AAA family ATPase [Candidatus Omnitrophota bacterium]